MSDKIFKLSVIEITSISNTWKRLNFFSPPKSLFNTNQIEYNHYEIENFVQCMEFLNTSEVDHNQLELMKANCPLLIQVFTTIIVDLESHSRNSFIDLMSKFSKINSRIYHIDYQTIGDCFISTIIHLTKLSNQDQFIFLKFLNTLLNKFQEYSEDPIQEISEYDYRLSYSDSNLSSNLSLVNDDVDLSLNETITSEFSAIKKSNSLTQSTFDNSVDDKYSIDIDELDNLNEDNDFNELESKYKNGTVPKGFSSLDDEEEDEAFDYINSFAESNSHSKSNSKKINNDLSKKKLKRRLSTINIRPSKANLSRVPTTTSSSSSKQDCIIM